MRDSPYGEVFGSQLTAVAAKDNSSATVEVTTANTQTNLTNRDCLVLGATAAPVRPVALQVGRLGGRAANLLRPLPTEDPTLHRSHGQIYMPTSWAA